MEEVENEGGLGAGEAVDYGCDRPGCSSHAVMVLRGNNRRVQCCKARSCFAWAFEQTAGRFRSSVVPVRKKRRWSRGGEA